MPEADQVSLREIGFSETFSDTFINQYPVDKAVIYPYRRLFAAIFLTTFWTFFMTILPVFAEVQPDNYYAGHPGWYTGNDVIRFVEPIGGLLLNFWILHFSGIFDPTATSNSTSSQSCIYVFIFGAALYGQGAGFHSASNMYKNCVETLMRTDDDRLNDLHYYMRTVWQHDASHYIYAVGYILMNVCQAYAFKDHKAPYLGLQVGPKLLMILASLMYGILLAAVAINFPYGVLVMLLFIVIYSFGIIGEYCSACVMGVRC